MVSKSDMTCKNSKMGGFSVTEMLIVVVLLVLMALVLVGNFFANRPLRAPINSCISNLRIIDVAKRQWALELHKQTTDTPSGSDLQPYLGGGPSGKLPFCSVDPKQAFDSSYSPNNLGTKPTCKINPTNHILP